MKTILKTILYFLFIIFITSCGSKDYLLKEQFENEAKSGSCYERTCYEFGEFILKNTSKDKKLKYSIKKSRNFYINMYVKYEDDDDVHKLKKDNIKNAFLCGKKDNESKSEVILKTLYPGEEINLGVKYFYYVDYDFYSLNRTSKYSPNCNDINKEYLGKDLGDFAVRLNYDYSKVYRSYSGFIEYNYEVVGQIKMTE